MHKFIEYISDLLLLHDCVIIPDLGGFICNYKSAYIDENTGMICPPSKDILFNRNLTHNDGLLVSWIACKEEISYEKATKQLALFSEDLKVRLNQKQRIAFGDIGVFYTDRRFNIIFESGKGNFLSDSYAMEPVEIEKIPQAEKKIKPANVPVAINEPSPYININSGNVLHKLLKYALAATAIAGIIVIIQFFFDSGDIISGTITNTTTIQPAITSMPVPVSESGIYNSVISPEHDYVDYDPINDLN